MGQNKKKKEGHEPSQPQKPMSFDQELLMDEEENQREIAFIRKQLPNDLKEKYTDDELLFIIDAIGTSWRPMMRKLTSTSKWYPITSAMRQKKKAKAPSTLRKCFSWCRQILISRKRACNRNFAPRNKPPEN